MKRLHIVGKSKDNRRLFLARTKGAKFGSYEVPISRRTRWPPSWDGGSPRPTGSRGTSRRRG